MQNKKGQLTSEIIEVGKLPGERVTRELVNRALVGAGLDEARVPGYIMHSNGGDTTHVFTDASGKDIEIIFGTK